MNTKRIIFWSSFVIIIALIIWGLIAAMNKTPGTTSKAGVPALVTSTDNVRGNPDAPVTLIEYGDFQCPACATYSYYVEKLYSEASSSMRTVFRHFPLDDVLPTGGVQHPNADGAAAVAEAAGAQGKFWDMYSLLYSFQNDWAEKPPAEAKSIFEGYGAKLGLDMTKFKNDEVASSTTSKIAAQKAEGVAIGINHTPSFFLNGKEVSPNNYDEFKTLIDQAITNATK